MTFEEYQKRSRETAVYPDRDNNVVYPTLGLAGEAGEVAEKVKKAIRDDGGVFTDMKRVELTKELGDVLWYIAQIATELQLSFEQIAVQNIDKLASRKARSVLTGSGDDR